MLPRQSVQFVNIKIIEAGAMGHISQYTNRVRGPLGPLFSSSCRAQRTARSPKPATRDERSEGVRRAQGGLSLSVQFAPAASSGDSWRAAAQSQNRTFVQFAAKIVSATSATRTNLTDAAAAKKMALNKGPNE
jgi:hypothetical protein